MAKVAAIGEVMVELAPYSATEASAREVMSLSFAGDTYNTAVYMARLGLQTTYVTNLGDDPYSAQIVQRMGDENIDTQLINTKPGRSPGLYIIRNSSDGERQFFYWRKESPARELFNDVVEANKLTQQLRQFDCVYLSGITLAIISAQARKTLLQSLQTLRTAGITIAFDSNYRPRLWPDKATAQQAIMGVLEHTDIALLTLEDEQLLWDTNTIQDCVDRYRNTPITELVVKRGASDTIIFSDGQELRVPVPPVSNIVDTTGAGDTFNAGYLAARLNHKSIVEAAQQGTRCAGVIIRYRGGVIDKSAFEQELINR
jgi:2-dehydro-3-deoxygluconokinase